MLERVGRESQIGPSELRSQSIYLLARENKEKLVADNNHTQHKIIYYVLIIDSKMFLKLIKFDSSGVVC